MGRVLEESIKRPLTDELLFGALENGGTATVDVEGARWRCGMPQRLVVGRDGAVYS